MKFRDNFFSPNLKLYPCIFCNSARIMELLGQGIPESVTLKFRQLISDGIPQYIFIRIPIIFENCTRRIESNQMIKELVILSTQKVIQIRKN